MLNLMWCHLALACALLFAALHSRTRARLLAAPPVARAERALEAACRWIVGHELLFVLLLFAAGAAARTVCFCELPRGQNQDGTMAGVEAFCLMRDGVDHWGISWPTYFKAWGRTQMSTLYSYLLIPFIRIMGLNKAALRLPMLLCSLASLLILWDLVRRTCGKGPALLALLAAAVNPWQFIQSRWALEANLLPHLLLAAVWLLCIGRKSRPALFGSMVLFGLAPYAYGVATFIVPELLIAACWYYLLRGYARARDAVLCAALFTAVAGPYFLTLAVQTFEWESISIGPFTLPRFEETMRANDIALFSQNPYGAIVSNLGAFLSQFLINNYGAGYNAIPWSNTMYPFAAPVYLLGLFLWWRASRRTARLHGRDAEERDREDLFRLLSFWLLGSLVNGLMVPGVVNRHNTVFYPLIILTAYGIWRAGKRLRTAGLGLVLMLAVSFGCLCRTYFFDEAYQRSVGRSFRDGLQQALTETRGWDYDHYYVFDQDKIALTQLMFAHEIDYSLLSEQRELPGPDGEPCGWYFYDRYIIVTDRDALELNPTDCAVYIFPASERKRFDEETYAVTEFGNYCAAYPRYWMD